MVQKESMNSEARNDLRKIESVIGNEHGTGFKKYDRKEQLWSNLELRPGLLWAMDWIH